MSITVRSLCLSVVCLSLLESGSVCSVSITVSLCLSVVCLSLLESVSVCSVSITVRSLGLSVVCLSLLGVCVCL